LYKICHLKFFSQGLIPFILFFNKLNGNNYFGANLAHMFCVYGCMIHHVQIYIFGNIVVDELVVFIQNHKYFEKIHYVLIIIVNINIKVGANKCKMKFEYI
jgi:hypothetical protein